MKCFVLLVLALTYVQLSGSIPLVIGHRGAPGHRPENTLASYDRAIFFGADYVEADIVSTKDHVLVASHNPDITHTTDVLDHPEFASRYAVKNVSGETYEGFFVDDFTAAELKSLRTRERYPFRNQSWNDMFSIPTLDEYLSFIQAKEKELNKKIGIYVETKHPSYYKSLGLPLEKILVDTLHNRGYRSADDMVFIESFESNLKEIRTMTNIPLVQLISGTEGDRVQHDTGRKWKSIASEEGLKEVATYAQGVGPHKTVIFKLDDNGAPIQTSFMKNAHDLGLFVHVWTFRTEREHFEKRESKVFGTIEEELEIFYNAGVDGVFTDQPDVGVRIKDEMFSDSTALEMFTTVTFSLMSAIGLFKISKILRLDKMNDELAKTIQTVGKDEMSNSH